MIVYGMLVDRGSHSLKASQPQPITCGAAEAWEQSFQLDGLKIGEAKKEQNKKKRLVVVGRFGERRRGRVE